MYICKLAVGIGLFQTCVCIVHVCTPWHLFDHMKTTLSHFLAAIAAIAAESLGNTSHMTAALLSYMEDFNAN